MLQIRITDDLLGMDIKALPDLYAYRLEAGSYPATEEIIDMSGIKMTFITVVNGNPGRIWGCCKGLFEQAIRQGSATIKESEV